MRDYLLRRLWLFIPTLLGITLLNFGMQQVAPGGPVESYLAKVRFGGSEGGSGVGAGSGAGRGTVTQEVVEEIKKKYGFDKPVHVRYLTWLKNVARLDFGYSHKFGMPVLDLIASKFPVSIRFGLTSFLLVYLCCIPLGIAKALRDGGKLDLVSSFAVFLLYSVPPYLLAIGLIHVFAGGRYFEWFPMGGLRSLDSEGLSFWERTKDMAWHMVLPLICFSINSFATLTVLMKNSLIEEVRKDYMRTALAKGRSFLGGVLRHGLRNALIPISVGIGGVVGILFTSNLLLEIIFNLDGFGKLFYDAALQRDYPVLMAQVFIGGCLGLLGQLLSDVIVVLVDPRISFSRGEST